ncbi:MAG: helix-turn-helix domain-containing protein [Clostridiales bacterium]|nr:helix-turn-helix domain-containing protein [Clostridiales bacterium]
MGTIKHAFSAFQNLFRQRSYFKQLLFCYIIASCAAFLLYSVNLISSMQKQYVAELDSVNEQYVEQARAFNESSLYDISSYCYNLLENNASLKKLLYSSEYDTLTAINSRELYDTIRNVSSMVVSCDLINYSSGTVLTRTSRTTIDQYADQDLLDYLEELSPSRNPVYWIPRIAREASDSDGVPVISLIFYTNKQGAMVVNLDYDSYVAQLNLSDTTDTFQMLLLNQYGQVFASTDKELFGEDYTENDLWQEVTARTGSSGSFTRKENGAQQTVHYIKNSSMGITYISILSAGGLFLRNESIRLTLRSSIIYLTATLLLSALASLLTYRPVQNLRRIISSQRKPEVPEIENPNDFAYLESVYKDLLLQSSNASHREKLYARESEEKSLYALITHNRYLPESDTAALENTFEYLYYCVIVFHIEPDAESLPMDAEKTDLSLIRFMIHNVASELAQSDLVLKNIPVMSSQAVILANFETLEAGSSVLPDVLKKTQQFFHKLGLFTLSIGVGNTVSELDTLSVSYDTARTALICGRFREKNCVCFYDKMEFTPMAAQTYPYEIHSSIIAAIKNQNADAAISAVEVFLEAISSYHYEQIYRCLLQLQSAIQLFEYNNHLTLFTDTGENALFTGSSPETDLTKADWKKNLSERCRQDIAELTEIRLHNKSKDSFVSQVQQIVEDNIYNINLSVTMIAERVGLSVNYLRSIYKENTGESLSAYISNRKLALVCTLLTESSMSIQEISDKLGFATKNYFFTFFKKHMGMTPSQYRKEHSAKQPV